ncbi:MAG: ABC transporter ATP-binding protein [Alphaproteobacteria bacterium]|nr:ABC transporter ATP-binding protein [Alphaproteobacteria bacterium]
MFVQLEKVGLRYGQGDAGTLALAEASIGIAKGEFVAVVGPSGCGKSTLLKLISGLHPATTGAVVVGGARVTRPLPICGMAFQAATLLPWRTTLDNVLLPLEIVDRHRSAYARDRAPFVDKARRLLAMVGLAGFETKYPWELSGGMQQRTSLCRALIHEPELLLLDEPFGALDAFTREELWDILQTLFLAQRPTVVLITHDLRESIYLADTVFVMSARPGRIISRTPVPFPRPRTLEDTFRPEFVEMEHALRNQIARQRRG